MVVSGTEQRVGGPINDSLFTLEKLVVTAKSSGLLEVNEESIAVAKMRVGGEEQPGG